MTPESVTLEQYLAAAVENKPKSIQKYLDLGGNVNAIDEVRVFNNTKSLTRSLIYYIYLILHNYRLRIPL